MCSNLHALKITLICYLLIFPLTRKSVVINKCYTQRTLCYEACFLRLAQRVQSSISCIHLFSLLFLLVQQSSEATVLTFQIMQVSAEQGRRHLSLGLADSSSASAFIGNYSIWQAP